MLNMLLHILIAIALGIFAGIITGLTPGIHINLVSLLVMTSAPFLLKYTSLLPLCVFIVSMSVTHTFLDFIPSVFIGAPSSDTVLMILPGHKMLLEGKSRNAVYLTLIGSFFSLLSALFLIPFLIKFTKLMYTLIKDYIGIILLLIVSYMVLKDKNRKTNILVFFMSSILGLITFELPLNQPLFPLLSGLFGLSILLNSLFDEINIPKQDSEIKLTLNKLESAKEVAAATIAGMFTAFFPGLGSSHGAVLASQFLRKISIEGFMILVGGINTVNFVLSLVTWYTLEKARNGSVVVMKEILPNITIQHLFLFGLSALIAGCFSVILGIWLSKIFAGLIEKVNYTMLISVVCIFIIILSYVFSGWLGMMVLFTGTCIGFIPIKLGTPKNHLMGCLLTPVIIYFIMG